MTRRVGAFVRCAHIANIVHIAQFTLIAAALSAGSAKAQTLPTAEDLIARHDSLVGGRAALEAHSSMRMIGTFTLAAAGIDAPLELLKRRPNQFVFRAAIPQLGDVAQGYDGSTAWSVQPGQGARILTGEAAAQMAERADFFGDLHDLTKFASVVTVAETEFHGVPVYRVRLTRHSGEIVHEYFNRATGLSAGGSTTTESATGPQESTTILAEYREFGGVRIATRIVQRTAQIETVIRIIVVEFDQLEATAMIPPDAVRQLIQATIVPPVPTPSTRPHR